MDRLARDVGPAVTVALLLGTDGATLTGADGVLLNDGLPTSDFDYTQTIMSQYANSPNIRALLASLDAALDPWPNITAFFNNVWNVNTAVGYGLDVWGRIVGVGRVLNVASGVNFGFAEPADSSETPFNQAPFYSGLVPATSNYAMPDSIYRTVILAKALANISDGSVRSINRVLQALFPNQGGAWVTDGLNLTMTYTFNWILSPIQFAIVTQTGVLPKPPGVVLTLVQL